MLRITHFAFLLPAAVAFAQGADLVAAAEPMPAEATEIATPNHDPYHLSLMGTAVAPVAAAVVTPNHDPHRLGLVPGETVAANPLILRAEPVVAAPSVLAFVAADNMLYAKANARLRAAPSTAAGIVAKLAANAPLRAIARSTDGAWWQVSLAALPDQHGRTGFVHRDAVTESQVVKTKPPALTAPVAAAYPPPMPARRRQGPFDVINDAMNWLANAAGTVGTGTPRPVVTRTQR